METSCPAQEVVAQPPRGQLRALAGAFVFLHMPFFAPKGDAVLFAEGLHKCLIPVGAVAQAVVVVGAGQLDPQGFPQLVQRPEQAHGVRAAGYGAGHAVAGGDQRIFLDEPAQLIRHHGATPGRRRW